MRIRKDFTFERSQKPDDSHTVIRLVTSWATPEKAVRDFLAALT